MKTRIATLVALALLLPAAPAAFADEVIVQVADKKDRRGPSDDEALALAALEGLINMPADRALPILKRVLASDQSTLVKKRALFVASQFDKPEAQQLLIDVAKQGDPKLRREAIRSIGIGGHAASLAVLKDVYAAGDDATKKEVLEAWLISDRRAEVYQVALAAKTEAEADRAIQTLGAMGARDELRRLGTERKASKGLLEAYAVSGDLESLKRIAATAPEAQTRADAVRRMGIIAGPEATQALREAYEKNTDEKVRKAALDGLLMTGNEQAVLELYKVAKTPEEKRTLLRTLTAMGGDAALNAIDQALGGKK